MLAMGAAALGDQGRLDLAAGDTSPTIDLYRFPLLAPRVPSHRRRRADEAIRKTLVELLRLRG